MRVAICIITRRRPDGLARLLQSLELISVPEGVEVELVVVENDAPSDRTPPPTRLRMRHAFEAEPGIPAARNRTLEIALADPGIEMLAFLDDDETVDSEWLVALLRTARRAERFGGDGGPRILVSRRTPLPGRPRAGSSSHPAIRPAPRDHGRSPTMR